MSIDLDVDKDGVATVTINRAEVHNALDAEHYAAISKAWQTVRDDPQIRCDGWIVPVRSRLATVVSGDRV